jgi:hypothetical protein
VIFLQVVGEEGAPFSVRFKGCSYKQHDLQGSQIHMNGQQEQIHARNATSICGSDVLLNLLLMMLPSV